MSLFSRLTLAWRLTLGFGLVLALMVGITLTGIQKVSEATLQQLESRLEHARKWLRRAG